MPKSDRLVVVGDIGGTHMRFAVADHDELTIDHYVQFRCSEFSSLDQGLAAYLKYVPGHPKKLCLAVAGPVEGDIVRMSNRPWVVDRRAIQAVSGTREVLLINDFEALAHILPYLSAHDLHKICGGDGVEGANRAVVGPGTGLGVAAITRCRDGWLGISGEGGHITFASQSREEFEIFDKFRFDRHHVSWDHLLSGGGLSHLYAVLKQGTGDGARQALKAEDIVAAAQDGEDEIAVKALDYFVAWLGRFAGDMALTFGARGGLYLGGGIAPKILPDLQRDTFRLAFQNKGRLSPYVETIPVFVIKAADAGLRGAAAAYSNRKGWAP